MEEVLECVVRDSGTLIGALARLALAVVVLTIGAAMVGVVAAIFGLASKHELVSPLLVGGGVALMVPAFWLAGEFVVFVVT